MSFPHLSAKAEEFFLTLADTAQPLPQRLIKAEEVHELVQAGLVHVVEIGPKTHILRSREGRAYARELAPDNPGEAARDAPGEAWEPGR